MRAAVMRGGELVVDEIPDPVPGPGQLLVRTLACGICGSDLHALAHGDQMVAMTAEGADAAPAGMPGAEIMDLDRDVVMGHEFSAEVVELGPETANHQPGDVVVSMPVAFDPAGIHPIGYSNAYPGGYGELMVLADPLAVTVPEGLDPKRAALTEPLAVGVHAVNRAGSPETLARSSALVVGCGPVGLAVVAAWRLAGGGPVVATDPSPARRALAAGLGADEVTDPGAEPGIEAWRRIDGTRPLVIFEAVGVPGLLDAALRDAPRSTRIVVVGVCMEPDTVHPMRGVVKELDIRFSFGYDPMEFAGSLAAIAEDRVDLGPLVTGEVDLDGVPGAFRDLGSPDAHAKILVVP